MLLTGLLVVAAYAPHAFGFRPSQIGSMRKPSRTSFAANAIKTQYFDQLIDHSNPSLGTFKQRYFFSDALWTGQGAPIVLSNPGEQSASGFDGYLTAPDLLQYALMKNLGAAGVVLEHRYWGDSSPYQQLTTENMKYLTVDQAIEDTKYFVENVQLPWTKKGVNSSHPDVVPWVNTGCSYPGVLSAYTQEKYPDVFAAAWASSAPVQAQGDFWQYFEPIEEGMPKNCSADVASVIKNIDNTLLNGNSSAKAALKRSFGLDNVTDDDFGSALVEPIYAWQDLEPDTGRAGDSFHKFCDVIEKYPNGTTNKGATGVGPATALTNYAKYFKANFACDNGGACFSTYDYTSDEYTDLTVGNGWDRQWYWMVCTEFGWFQDGDPGNYSSIVSSLVTVDYNLRQCNHMFPLADGTPGNYSPDVAGNNAEHQGWNLKAERLFVVNGQYDPWRSATLSSIWAPPVDNTDLQEVEVVAGGHHCWDWEIGGASLDPDIKRVATLGAAKVKGWLQDWYKAHPNVKNTMPSGGLKI